MGPKARALLKKTGRDTLIQIFKPLNEELMAMEADGKKIQEDLAKREANKKLVEETKEKSGAEKEKLLVEQKERDMLLKQQFHEMNR
jgi:Skp family chaperone for outer membrane proteins